MNVLEQALEALEEWRDTTAPGLLTLQQARCNPLGNAAIAALKEAIANDTPTEAMIKAGNDWASHATDAHIAKCMGELGSTKEQRDWQLSNFENVDLIQMYLNDEIDSVAGIYMAMERAK